LWQPLPDLRSATYEIAENLLFGKRHPEEWALVAIAALL